jgi:transmembrane sensor
VTRSFERGSFEDFVHWLGTTEHDSEPERPVPNEQVLSAAREAWQEHQSLQRAQREALSARVRVGTHVAEEDKPLQSFWAGMFAAVMDALAPRWQSAAITAAAVAVATLGFLLVWNLRPIAPVSAPAEPAALHFVTQHGQQQTYRLEDNSVLHLNTDSAVTVRYSESQRLVLLTSGEVHFEVTHEPKRAFRVLAGSAEVVDLGTKFDVRLSQDSTVVTVVEGRVAVAPSPTLAKGTPGSSRGEPPRSVQLVANQQIRVLKGEWPAAPIAVDAERTTAWLHRQIAFDHETLGHVVVEFNRYAPKPIEITTPELRDLEVGGVFSTDDPEEFLAFLRSFKGVRVDVTATRILVSQK